MAGSRKSVRNRAFSDGQPKPFHVLLRMYGWLGIVLLILPTAFMVVSALIHKASVDKLARDAAAVDANLSAALTHAAENSIIPPLMFGGVVVVIAFSMQLLALWWAKALRRREAAGRAS